MNQQPMQTYSPASITSSVEQVIYVFGEDRENVYNILLEAEIDKSSIAIDNPNGDTSPAGYFVRIEELAKVDRALRSTKISFAEIPGEFDNLKNGCIIDYLIKKREKIAKNISPETLPEYDKLTKQIEKRSQKQQSLSHNTMQTDDQKEPIFKTFADCARESKLFENIEAKALIFQKTGKYEYSGITLGYDIFDDCLDGFQKGQLIVVGARTGIGKTWFAMNVLYQVSVVRKIPVAVISLEMSNNQLQYRLLSMITDVQVKAVQRGCLDADELNKLESSVTELSKSTMMLTDKSDLSDFTKLKPALEAAAEIAELIIIDYLGLLKYTGENRVAQVSEITRSLKVFAMEKKIPVIILAQVNRQGDRENEPPKLSELRESGSIEQDADVVIFLHPHKPSKTIDIIIAKNRFGEEKTISFEKSKSWLLAEIGEKEEKIEKQKSPTTQPKVVQKKQKTGQSYFEDLKEI